MNQIRVIIGLAVLFVIIGTFHTVSAFLPLTPSTIIIQSVQSTAKQGTYNTTQANNIAINTGGYKINFLNGTGIRTNIQNSKAGTQVNVTISNSAGTSGVTSLNGLNGALTIACVSGNTTCTTSGGNTITVNTAWNIVTTNLSPQEITKQLTIDLGVLGGNLNVGSFALTNSGHKTTIPLTSGIVCQQNMTGVCGTTTSANNTGLNVGKATGSIGPYAGMQNNLLKFRNDSSANSLLTISLINNTDRSFTAANQNNTGLNKGKGTISAGFYIGMQGNFLKFRNMTSPTKNNVTITLNGTDVVPNIGSHVLMIDGANQTISKPLIINRTTINHLTIDSDASFNLNSTITVDNDTVANTTSSATLTTIQNLGFGVNHNRIVIVGVAQKLSGGPSPPANVTYNGILMTQLVDDLSTTREITMYGILDKNLPSISGLYNIKATFNPTPTDALIGAISFTGVNQTSLPTNTNHTNALTSNANVTLTTQKNYAVLVDFMMRGGSGSNTPNSPQIQDWNKFVSPGSQTFTSGGSHKAIKISGTKTTMGWTFTSTFWNIAALELDPVVSTIQLPTSSSSSGIITSQNIGKGTGSSGVLAIPTSSVIRGKNLTCNSPVSCSNNSTDITITSSGLTTALLTTQNIGKGTGSFGFLSTPTASVVKSKNATAGVGIGLSGNNTDIIITNTSPLSSFSFANIGKGTGSLGWLSSFISNTLKSKNVTAGNGITIAGNITDITITNNSPLSSLSFQNIGHGGQGILSSFSNPIFKGKNITSTNPFISVSANNTDVNLAASNQNNTGLNTGRGTISAGPYSAMQNNFLKFKNMTSITKNNMTISGNITDVNFNIGSHVLMTDGKNQTITKMITFGGDSAYSLSSTITFDNSTRIHGAGIKKLNATQLLGFPSNHNRVVIVAVAQRVSNPVAPTVTYNGVTMSQLVDDTSGNRRLTMYGILDSSLPPNSGTYNITSTFSTIPSDEVMGAVSFTGVNQTSLTSNTNHTNNASSKPASIILTSKKNNAVFVNSVLVGGQVTITPDASEITDWNTFSAVTLALTSGGAHELVPIANTKINMSWSGFANSLWHMDALELDPISITVSNTLKSLNGDLSPNQFVICQTGNTTCTNSTGTVKIGNGVNDVIINGAYQDITKPIKVDQLNASSSIVDNNDNTKKITFLNSGAASGTTTIIRINSTQNQYYNLPNSKGTQTIAMKPQSNFTTGQNGGNSTGTNSAAIVMLGDYATLTPQVTGRVMITVTGYVDNAVVGGGCRVDIRESTSNMGTNGAPATGTVLGTNVKIISPTASANETLSKTVAFTSGVTGTKYFFDLGFDRLVVGTCNIRNLDWFLMEY